MKDNLLKWIRRNGIIIFLLLVINLFGFPFQIHADNTVDSLQSLVLKAKNDTNKVNLLIQLSDAYSATEYDQALTIGKSCLALSEELDFNRGKLFASIKLGRIFKNIGEFDSAIIYTEKAIKYAVILGNEKQQVNNFNVYGSLLRRIGYYSSAMDYHQKSLELSKKLDYQKGIADSYVFIGIINELQLSYDSAINNYYKSIRIYEKLDRQVNIGIAFLNIGDMYENLLEHEQSLQNYRRGLTLFEEGDQLYYIGLSNIKIGIIHSEWGNYDSAMHYYKLCKISYDSINDVTGLGHLDINIGNVYFARKMYDSAYFHFNRAKDAFLNMDFKRGYLNAMLSLGKYYTEKKQTTKALGIYDECWNIAMMVDPQALRGVYLNVLNIYKNEGDYLRAFEYQTKYLNFKDSSFTIDKTRIIADIELKYEKEKDQAQILSLENENLEKDLRIKKRTNQRNIYLFSGSGIITLILFMFIYYRQKARKNKIIAEQRIYQLEKEKKLLAAKFLVEGQEQERKRIAKELHDGLGVLLSTTRIQFTSIKDKSPENKSLIDKAAKLLEQATGDVRKISHNMMPGLLTRFGLYEAAEELIDQLNETAGLNANCIISGDPQRLTENTEIMLYRVIQELVNNSLKHAEAKNIRLQLKVLSGEIDILYTDDGKGFNVSEKLQLKSIGLNSIKSRIDFLGGNLSIESETGKGVNYVIQVPTV